MKRITTPLLTIIASAALAILTAPTLGQSENKQDETQQSDPNTPATGELLTFDENPDPTTQESAQGSETKPLTEPITEGSATTQGSDLKQTSDTAFEKFSSHLQELALNEQQVKSLVISMPVGFKDKQVAQKAKIAELKQWNQQVYRELFPIAMKSFENFPNTQEPINNYLIQQLQVLMSGQSYVIRPFNPPAAKRLYQKLVDGGVESPVLDLLGYRIHYVLHEFEKSRVLLIEAAKKGKNAGQPAMDDLRIITGNWNRELHFQELDAKANNPRIKIEMDCGEMVLELFEDQAPNTVANFISLVESGFYNGLAFYKVGTTEVAMAGSPTNDGKGGPDYNIKPEVDGENIRHHFTGVISHFPPTPQGGAARFLIAKQPTMALNGQTTAFGRVIEGLENLYKIKVVDRTRQTNMTPQQPTIIHQITVLRKRDHEYIPEKIANAAPTTTGN